MADQDKHKHHKQPRHFLKGFAIPPSNPYQKDRDIWVYKKGEPFQDGMNPSLDSVSEVGYANDFYAYRKDDSTIDYNKYENILMRDFEQPGQPVLEKIRRLEEISENEKDVFARYVGSMITRGDWWRGVGKKALENSADEMTEKIIQQISDPAARENVKNLFRERVEALQAGELFNEGVVRQAYRVSEVLRLMVWRFVVIPPGMFFLTGDKPVFYYFLQRADSELVFPLSSDVTLSMSWQLALPGHRAKVWKNLSRSYWQVDARTVEHIRAIVCAGADAEVYGPRKAEWLVRFINNRPAL